MSLLLTIMLMTILLYIERQRSDPSDARDFWWALGLRFVGACLLPLLYDFYYKYPGDTQFFDFYAHRLYEVFCKDSGEYFRLLLIDIPDIAPEPRSAFFIKLLSLIYIVTDGYYFIAALWFAFFSFWCSYQLVKKIEAEYPSAGNPARVAFLFTPSFVFWASGVLKETVAFGALAMLCVYFISIIRGKKIGWLTVIGILFYSYLLIILKYYWAAVLIPCMITGLVIRWTVEKRTGNPWKLAGSWVLVFMVLSFVASLTHPNFHLDRLLSVIVENNQLYNGDIVHYYNLSPDWWSMLVNSPLALWSGLFGPISFTGSASVATWVASVENLLLLGLVIWKLRSLRMPAVENRVIVFTTLVYILVLCIFLALSTPNLGTLSRYRVGFFPFFVFMILSDHPLFKRKIQINKE